MILLYSFNGMDSFNVSAVPLTVNIKMCDCNGNGECQFDSIQLGKIFNETFKLVECNCTTGWLGDFCETDKNGCADTPCSSIQNCTDLTPEEEQQLDRGFNCSACPDGYNDIGGICIGTPG